MAENLVQLTDENFNTEVLDYPGDVLVDFWAPWCGPCRMVGPIVEQIAQEQAGKLKVGKFNTDEGPETAARFGIRSIPTLILFRNGTVETQIVGALPKDQLTRKLNLN